MDYFPIFLDLVGRPVVVVGGGEIASRKIALLESAGASIRVVAPALKPGLTGTIHHLAKVFEPADLAGACLCIAATDNRAVNAAAAEAAKARNIPVNVVDDPELCSFIMPSIVDRGRIVVAISSGGVSPVLARLIRTRLDMALPHGIARLADLAAAWRDRVRAALPDPGRRRRFWEHLFETHAVDDPDGLDLNELLASPLEPARLDIVRVDPADPDSLALRDLKRIRAADLILYDPALPRIVLDQARRDANIVTFGGSIAALTVRAEAELALGRRVVGLTALPTESSVAPD